MNVYVHVDIAMTTMLTNDVLSDFSAIQVDSDLLIMLAMGDRLL